MNRIDSFLELVVKQQGSDLHLVAGNPPRLRLFGEVYSIKYRDLTAEETESLLFEIMAPTLRENFKERMSVDFAYEVPGLARFRVNVFRHLDGIGAVFRSIPTDIPSFEELGLPPVTKSLANHNKGLLLVTGPTGSGKSTTLAALLDYVNRTRRGHILTIEDPIEFIHSNKQCLMSQREVGHHTKSFADALRSALREDPNIIMVGEMRDLETIHLAVTAAEMGILVMGTLHTNGAAATVDRIINTFPAGEEPYIRTMLSTSLNGIISQQLVRRADNKGRVAAIEVMVNTTATANVIREGRPDQLQSMMQSGALVGMQTLDTALRRLVDANLISGNEAYLKARHKADFAHLREEELPL